MKKVRILDRETLKKGERERNREREGNSSKNKEQPIRIFRRHQSLCPNLSKLRLKRHRCSCQNNKKIARKIVEFAIKQTSFYSFISFMQTTTLLILLCKFLIFFLCFLILTQTLNLVLSCFLFQLHVGSRC